MTRDEAGRLLTILRATYHNVKLDNPQATVDAWHLALADAPFGLMQRAARGWIGTEKWFPTPAELRLLAIDQAGVLPSVPEAWAMVLAHIRGTGLIGGAPFSGPREISQAVAAIGGWRVLRMSEDPGRDRQAFGRAYETYRMRTAREMDMGELAAITDGERMALPS